MVDRKSLLARMKRQESLCYIEGLRSRLRLRGQRFALSTPARLSVDAPSNNVEASLDCEGQLLRS